MSDYIPFEIQIQIMKKLPIKSLIQFRSVSKQWKTLIDSSDFIIDHTVCSQSQPQQHLLIWYQIWSCEDVFISFADDSSFPQNKWYPTVPTSVRLLTKPKFIGMSHGLVCVFGYSRDPGGFPLYSGTATAVVWNPFIRKSVSITIPNADHETCLRFGVCPRTCEPKIVKFDRIKTVTGSSSVRWEVEVFTLSSGVRRSCVGNLSSELVPSAWHHPQEVIDGTIYWLGTSHSADTSLNLLISFDLSYEELREIHLPVNLALHRFDDLSLCNRCGSIAVIKKSLWGRKYEVWMMEKTVDSKSFIKLFSMENEVLSGSWPMIIRRNGELVMIKVAKSAALVVYEPFSKHFNDLGQFCSDRISGFSMSPFTVSLILLDK